MILQSTSGCRAEAQICFPRGLQFGVHLNVKLEAVCSLIHTMNSPGHCSRDWEYMGDQHRHPCHSGTDVW